MPQIRAAIAAVAVLFVSLVMAAGSVSAQSVTPTNTNPNSLSTPVPTSAKGTTAANAPKPIAILHFLPQDTAMVGTGDVPVPTGAYGNHAFNSATFRAGYGAQLFLGKGYLSYSHTYIDQNNGRVTTVKNTYTYPSRTYDRVDDASLNYPIDNFVASIGYHQRVRVCCGTAAEGAANPTAYHYLYAQGSTRLGPKSQYFGRLVGLTLQAADVPHNTSPYFASPYCTASAADCVTPAFGAIPSEGNKIKITYTGNVTLPVGNFRKSSFALFATYFNDWDYYMSSPIMYLYNRTDIGFIKKFSPYISLTVNDSNEYQHHQPFQYVYPNTINRNKLVMSMDFALPIK